MKRFRNLLVAVLICCLLLTAGCSGQNGGDESVTTTLLAGVPNGVWAMISTGLGESLNRNYPGSVIHTNPGAPVPNLLKLNEGDAEFALIHSSNAYEAYRGIGQFDSKKTNISAVAVFYPSVAQLIFKTDYGVSTLREIIDNKMPVRLSVGPEASSMDITFQRILAEYDLTYDDVENWGGKIYKKSFADTATMFSDDVIDGIFLLAGAPTSFITPLSVNEDMIMLEFESELFDAMMEKYGYGTMVLSSDKYTFMDSDIDTFNSFTMLGASIGTSEDVVYKLTKSLYQNLDYVKSLHAALKGVNVNLLLMDAGIPLHPGAQKYYKEIGLID